MIFREATSADICAIQRIRRMVTENVLTSTVTDEMCSDMLNLHGKGWICEVDGEVVGFSIADNSTRNIWALFVHPIHEHRGIGRNLLESAVRWLFTQGSSPIWLATEPGTRAEKLYQQGGWTSTGVEGSGEIRFELKQPSNRFVPSAGTL